MPKKNGQPTMAELRKEYGGSLAYYREACKSFDPFEQDQLVCDNCGEQLSDHPPMYRPYNEAMTRWFVKNAGIKGYYGALDTSSEELLLARKHLLDDCGIDYEKTGEIEVHNDPEFNGTFTDTQLYVSALGATVYCKCGEYNFSSVSWSSTNGLELRLPEGFTLGQVMWQVIKEGEK